MKTFVTTLLSVSLLCCASYMALAQEYRFSPKAATLKFQEVKNLAIEGYSGKEVVITYAGSSAIPERAKGLKPINNLGVEDNTGIGLSVKEQAGVVEIQQIARRNSGDYTVKVPASLTVQVACTGVDGSDVQIRNLQNEVEVSTLHNSIMLENMSGPVLANSVHGTVTASFSAIRPANPVSIVSIHNEVDVSVPADAKADLTLSSQYGNIYTDMNLEYKKTTGDMKKISSVIEGTLNGGGTEIVLKSNHNNVYLRKK